MCALRLPQLGRSTEVLTTRADLVWELTPLSIILIKLIKYRHLPRRRTDLRDSEPTYRTFYHTHTHTKGMSCEAKEGRGRIQKDG